MLQKEQRFVQVENVPQLRLAPPAVYHEKVKKGTDLLTGESSSDLGRTEKQSSRSKQLRDLKVKGSSLRFPLKSNIFGEFFFSFPLSMFGTQILVRKKKKKTNS